MLYILDLLMLHSLNNYINIILWEYIAQIQKTQRISTSSLFLFSVSIPLGSSLKFSAANWLVKQTAVLPLEHPRLHKWSSGQVYTHTPPQLPLKTNALSVHQELNFCQLLLTTYGFQTKLNMFVLILQPENVKDRSNYFLITR